MDARELLLKLKSETEDVASREEEAVLNEALAALDLRDLLTKTLADGITINFTGNKGSDFVGCSVIGVDPENTQVVSQGGESPLAALQDVLGRFGR